MNVSNLNDEDNLAQDQYEDELDLIYVHGLCPEYERIRDTLTKINSDRLKSIYHKNFYNSEVVSTIGCITDVITMVDDNRQLSTEDKIKYWFKDPIKISDNIYLSNLNDKQNRNEENRNDDDDENNLFILKTSKFNNDNLVHECFVGLFGTNLLRTQIPNFSYVYGIFNCSLPIVNKENKTISWCNKGNSDYLIYENIIGESMEDQILKKNIDLETFLNIYLQIIFSLRLGSSQFGFTHYDLHSGNVMLRNISDLINENNSKFQLNGEYVIPYQTEMGVQFLKTNLIATIIDYEYSHIYYQGTSYGYYGLKSYNIYPNLNFPYHDLYKFLCFCLENIKRSGLNQLFKEVSKILSFFTKEDPDMVISQQHSTFYSLNSDWIQFESSQDPKSSPIDSFIQFIRKLFPKEIESFLTSNQSEIDSETIQILNCDYTKCQSQDLILDQIGLSYPEEIFTTVDFYNYVPPLVRLGYRSEVEKIKSSFPASSALKNDLELQSSLINQFNCQINSIPNMGNRLAEISEYDILENIDFLNQYSSYISEIIKGKELLNKIEFLDRSIFYTSQYYPSIRNNIEINSNRNKINDLNHLKSIQSEKKSILNQYINSIDSNIKTFLSVIPSNVNPPFDWYITDLPKLKIELT